MKCQFRERFEEELQNTKYMSDLAWHIRQPEDIDRDSGVYFLRTNVAELDEKTNAQMLIYSSDC